MKKLHSIFMVGTAALLSQSATLWADTVKIPLGQQAQGKQSMDRPTLGMDKDRVRATFGEPLSAQGPIGEPPIYYWEYPDYTVYFESDIVLHTVFKHHAASQNP